MSANLATAYVTILPSMKGMRKGIASELTGAADQGKKGFLSRIGGLVPGVGKVAGIAGGLLTGAIAGVAVTGGFNRAMAIEQAQAKLSGLGHDTKNVEKIMDNASAAVKGTAYGLGDAATVAASAVAAGVKPGQELQDVLTLVGDAASIAGTDMGSMGAIFNKVKASNKLQMDSINQLHDAGIPALALVAERLGVTAEEASKMASDGEVDFATFAAAMQDGMGGAAQKSGETFTGALANTKAALGRIGETFLGPFLSAATVAMSEWAIPALDAINAALKPVMGAVGVFLDGVMSGLTLLKDNFGGVVSFVRGMTDQVVMFWGDMYGFLAAGDPVGVIMDSFNLPPEHPVVTWTTGGWRTAMNVYDQWSSASGTFMERLSQTDLGDAIWMGFDGSDVISDLSAHLSWAESLIEITYGEWKAAQGDLYAFLSGNDVAGIFASWFGTDMQDSYILGIQRINQGLMGIYDLIVGGDFTGNLTRAFGWQENHPMVGFLLSIRDELLMLPAIIAPVVTAAVGMWQAFQNLASGFMTGLSPALASLNGGFGGLVTSAIQLWQSLSPVGILLQALVPYAAQLGQFAGVLVGAFLQLAAAVIPLGLQLASVLVPMISQIVAALLPALGSALMAVSAIIPGLVAFLSQVATVAVQIVSAVAPLVVQLASGLAPILSQIAMAVVPLFNAALAVAMPLLSMLSGIVQNILVPALQVLIPLVLMVAQQFAHHLVGAITGVTNILNGLVQFVTGIFTGSWSQAWAGLKQVFLGAVQTLWHGVNVLLIGRMVGAVRAGASALLGLFRGGWSSIVSAVKAAWASLTQSTSGGVAQVSNLVGSLVARTLGFFRNMASGMASITRNAWAVARSAFGGAIAALKTMVSQFVGAIRGFFVKLGSNMKSLASSGLNAVKGIFSRGMGALKNSVSDGARRIVDLFRGMPGRFKNALGNLGSFLKKSGASLLSGFRDGIVGGFNKAKDAVKRGMKKIREFFPFSPAKVGPFAGRGYTSFSGAALTRDFADAIAGEGRYLAQRTDDFMSSARFDTPMPTVPAVPDYVPASWSDRYGGDMQQDTQAQAEALAEALRGVEVRIDGRKTVGYLDTVRRT